MRKPLFTGARIGVTAVCLAITFAVLSTGAVKKSVIKKPTHDPMAEEVELFAAIEAGQIDARLILKDEFEGNVFIENKTDKPLTIKLPRSAVGVQVLKQGFGPMAGGQGGPDEPGEQRPGPAGRRRVRRTGPGWIRHGGAAAWASPRSRLKRSSKCLSTRCA